MDVNQQMKTSQWITNKMWKDAQSYLLKTHKITFIISHPLDLPIFTRFIKQCFLGYMEPMLEYTSSFFLWNWYIFIMRNFKNKLSSSPLWFQMTLWLIIARESTQSLAWQPNPPCSGSILQHQQYFLMHIPSLNPSNSPMNLDPAGPLWTPST